MAAGLLDDLLSTGYTTPGGIIRRKKDERRQALEDANTERALKMQEKGLQLQSIPVLMDYQKQQEAKAGYGSARNLWRAKAGLAPQMAKAPSQSEVLIQSILAGLK